MSMNRGSSRLGYMQGIVGCMQNELTDLWPLNPKTVPLLGYPKIIPYTPSLNTLGSLFSFSVILRTNIQTETDSKILPTPNDIVGVGNNAADIYD